MDSDGDADVDGDRDVVVVVVFGNGRALVFDELLRSASNFKLKSVSPAWPQLKPSSKATLQARVTQLEIFLCV